MIMKSLHLMSSRARRVLVLAVFFLFVWAFIGFALAASTYVSRGDNNWPGFFFVTALLALLLGVRLIKWATEAFAIEWLTRKPEPGEIEG